MEKQLYQPSVARVTLENDMDYTDLIERLNNLVILDEVRSDNRLGKEAADAIEALMKERDNWKHELRAAIEAAEKVGPDAVVVDLQSCFPSCAVVPVFPVGTLFYLHPPSAEIEELRKDAERYHFILPIVTGIDSDNADKIAMAIATQLMKGLDGDAAIDAAMQEKQP